MMTIIVGVFWVTCVVACVYYAGGFIMNETYDYRTRRKTFNGTKALICFGILVVMYYIPWQRFGVFV